MDLKLPDGAYPETIRDTNGHEYDIVYNPEGLKVWQKSEEATLSGSAIVMPEVAREQIEVFTIYGRSEQKQYSGKNLIGDEYYFGGYSSSVPFIVPNNNITLPFVPQRETQGIAKLYYGTSAGQAYTFSVTNPNENATVRIAEYSDFESTKDYHLKLGFVPGAPNKCTYTAQQDGSVLVCLLAGTWLDGKTLLHVCTESELLQLEEGSTATAYEPYVGGKPSPSPEYPQEIVSVTEPMVNRGALNLFPRDYFAQYGFRNNLANAHLDENSPVVTVQADFTAAKEFNFQTLTNFDPSSTFLQNLPDDLYMSIVPVNGTKPEYNYQCTFRDVKANYEAVFYVSGTTSPRHIKREQLLRVTRWQFYFYGMSEDKPLNAGDSFQLILAATPVLQPVDSAELIHTIQLPYTLRGIDNVRDSLTVYADGTGELVQRVVHFSTDELLKFRWYIAEKTVNGIQANGVAYTTPKVAEIPLISNSNPNGLSNTLIRVESALKDKQDGYMDFRYTQIRINAEKISTSAECYDYIRGRNIEFQTVRATPITIALTPSEVQSILTALKPYKPTTTIWNDQDADVSVTYRKGIAAQSST